MQDFVWPIRINSSCKKVFEKKAKVTQGSIACAASEALSVYNVLHVFLSMRVMRPDMPDQLRGACLCYMAMCSVIDMLSSNIDIDANKFHDAVKLHCNMFIMIYGKPAYIPKHHFSLHLPSMLVKHGLLISLFTNERKHRSLKRYAPSRLTEPNMLRELLSLQMREIDLVSKGIMYLVDPRPAPDSMVALVRSIINVRAGVPILTSREANASSGLRCFRRDVVTAEQDGVTFVGQVQFHVHIGDICWSRLCLWQGLPAMHTYHALNDNMLIPTDSITHVCTYRRDGDVAFILPPKCFS
jgi:hypothetical protein